MFDQAIKDYSESLNIRKAILADNDRSIAEMQYCLALAYEYSGQFTPALENTSECLRILKARIESLSTNSEKEKKEIDELKEIIPELDLKVFY